MTRRDWWLGVGLVLLGLLAHAAWPRYEWRQVAGGMLVRIDRWSGAATLGTTAGPNGQWQPRTTTTIIKAEPLEK